MTSTAEGSMDTPMPALLASVLAATTAAVLAEPTASRDSHGMAVSAVPLPDTPLPGAAINDFACVVRGLLPPAACDALVAAVEANVDAVRPALLSEDLPRGGHPDLDNRRSGMLRFRDPAFAGALWARLRATLGLDAAWACDNDGPTPAASAAAAPVAGAGACCMRPRPGWQGVGDSRPLVGVVGGTAGGRRHGDAAGGAGTYREMGDAEELRSGGDEEDEQWAWFPCGVNDSIRILRYTPGDYFKPHTDGRRVVSDSEKSFLSVVVYLNSQQPSQQLQPRQTAPPALGTTAEQQEEGRREAHALRGAGEADKGAADVGDSDGNDLVKATAVAAVAAAAAETTSATAAAPVGPTAGGFEGGSTRFHATRRDDAAPVAVEPVQGSALVFDHDLYHEGELLRAGVKYAIRTDVLFRRRRAKK